MEKTSKESVDERNLIKAFLAVRGLSCQACRLQQVTHTTVLVVPHLSPIPSQLQKKSHSVIWLTPSAICMQCCLCKKCNGQQNYMVGKDHFPHPAGNAPPRAAQDATGSGAHGCFMVIWCLPGPLGLFLADGSPLCTDQCVRLSLFRCRSLHFSLYYTLLKGQITQNKMLNLCIQFALGGWNVDCCILSRWHSSRWEIVSLKTTTRKWIQMKWYIGDDDCYFPLRWHCSMICGSL